MEDDDKMGMTERSRLLTDLHNHRTALKNMTRRLAEEKEENARLKLFALELAERIFKAHEVLGNLAEKRKK